MKDLTERSWFLILLLLFCFPLGVYYSLKKRKARGPWIQIKGNAFNIFQATNSFWKIRKSRDTKSY